jgi:hypothetical protein
MSTTTMSSESVAHEAENHHNFSSDGSISSGGESSVPIAAYVASDDESGTGTRNREVGINMNLSDAEAKSTSSSSIDPADGEYHQLLKSIEDESPPLTHTVAATLKRELSRSSLTDSAWYGQPLSQEDAKELFPPGDSGLVWSATIIPDNYLVTGKMSHGLNRRDFDVEAGKIKPRRPSLPITAKDFFSSITTINGPSKGQIRCIFSGVLNGWPGLRSLELISLEHRRDSSALPSARELMSGQILWVKVWSCDEEGMKGKNPMIRGTDRVYRAKLRGAPWTGLGWSIRSPGFCFWFEAQSTRPRVSFGTNMLTEIESEPVCTRLHMISHRYAVKNETPRDRLTYHSVCLLEWDHGRYCTLIESAYLNGMGGYRGQSNWYDDRDAPVTSLYQALPLEMICPWRSSQSEVRCYDIPVKSLEEFRAYMAKYEGYGGRFLDPRFTFSHSARLTFRSKTHVAQYLLNYIMRDSSYAELKRNCQTFAADLCSFLAGKKGVAPFHPVNRIEYQNRTYLFLYDSHLYEKKSSKR